MRTALGITVAAVALGTFAVPAQAGCVDSYLSSGSEYVAPRQGTVTRDPYTGAIIIQPNAVVPDATNAAGFAAGVALNETGKVLALVDCIK